MVPAWHCTVSLTLCSLIPSEPLTPSNTDTWWKGLGIFLENCEKATRDWTREASDFSCHEYVCITLSNHLILCVDMYPICGYVCMCVSPYPICGYVCMCVSPYPICLCVHVCTLYIHMYSMYACVTVVCLHRSNEVTLNSLGGVVSMYMCTWVNRESQLPRPWTALRPRC